MPLSGEEIRLRLQIFAARWSVYSGSERAEAQTFLNELFACYGTDRREVAKFELAQEGRFLDLIWPTVCLFEMKRPSEAGKLARHRAQALDYWREVDDERGAPRYVVICAFERLEIWEPGRFPKKPVLDLDLVDLPDRYDSLLFLAGDEPVFSGNHEAVTRDAVEHVSGLYVQLNDRRAAAPDVLRSFILQTVWCMFAEDLGMLPAHRFSAIVEDLIGHPRRSSADDLGQLFAFLNDPARKRPTTGLYTGVPYANGQLFADPARVDLAPDELVHLRRAADFNWRHVQPAIFGALLEGGLGKDKQWHLGAHYTHEADIEKVVQPTIVEPWLERIASISTHAEAKAAQTALMAYVVLDPACGSGNFLYVAYRHLRRIEQQLNEIEIDLRRAAGLPEQRSFNIFFPLNNLKGIELEGFAVQLARVTLWMGHKLAVDEIGIDETVLPLETLSGIRIGDALRTEWPRADAIIGNPPFHGSQHLREELGDEYVEWLKRRFGVGVKDYCTYWFRMAAEHLGSGGRAGLVGTNSISQNRGRSVSLEYIVDKGGTITNAVSSQKWPGAAAVHVSIVNWINGPPIGSAVLDGVEVPGITPSLTRSDVIDVTGARRLAGNAGVCFQGAIPSDDGGFILTAAEAQALLIQPAYARIIRPFLTASDVTTAVDQAASRWIIDFASMSLEEAMEYPEALDRARRLVKPGRADVRRGYGQRWWQFAEPRRKMRSAIATKSRFIGLACHGKRILFSWYDPIVLPSNAIMAFALDDDYSFGVLASSIHLNWARAQNSTIKGDPRYTPTSSFETFPFPTTGTFGERAEVARLARELVVLRSALCRARGLGLTTLYNLVDAGGFADLRDIHRRIDEAVARCYGWPASVAHDAATSNGRLLALNVSIGSGAIGYTPFAAPAAQEPPS